MTNRINSVAAAALLCTCNVLVVASCTDETGNRPPRIAAAYLESDGSRVRAAPAGARVDIVVVADDPDGDRLDYSYHLPVDGGEIDGGPGPRVTWSVGESGHDITVVVRDGRGGQASYHLPVPAEYVATFAGTVVDADGEPITNAEVDVDGTTTRTDANGNYALELPGQDRDRYVLTIRTPDAGLISEVLEGSALGGTHRAPAGVSASFDPAQSMNITGPVNCAGDPSSMIDWTRHPRQAFPQVFDAQGDRLHRFYPDELRQARALLGDVGSRCSQGISVSIPPNAVADAQGNVPAGPVQLAVSTVNVYSGNMPGDWTAASSTGNQVMQSYGAGTVTIARGDQPLQLRDGVRATIRIPIDPVSLRAEAAIADSIPLVRYDEQRAVWEQIGVARLDREQNVYVAEVDHLSTFNMDTLKEDQACVRIDSQAISGAFTLQVLIPQGINAPRIITKNIANPLGDQLHAIYNLPTNTWIELTPIKAGVPLGTFVVNTGDTQDNPSDNNPDPPYTVCKGFVEFSETVGPLVTSFDGMGHVLAPFPWIIVTLADGPTGTDVYPVGSQVFYLDGLFDSGSTIVALPAPIATFLNMGSTDFDVRFRISGADDVDVNTFFGPINEPGSASFAADAEVRAVSCSTASCGSGTPPGILVGAPVVNRVVAELDYRVQFDHPNPNLLNTFIGAQFYAPGDATIPVPLLKLELARFGTEGMFSGHSTSTRHLLRNVSMSFRVDPADPASVVTITDDQTAAAPFHFFIDTGTRRTYINTRTADALGIPWTTTGGGSVDCNTNRAGPEGFVLERFAVTAVDPDYSGTYEVMNAVVCVDIDGDIVDANYYVNDDPPPPIVVIDVMLGMNLFDHTPILVHPTDGFFGILSGG